MRGFCARHYALIPKKLKKGLRAADFFWRNAIIFFLISVPVFIGVGTVIFKFLEFVNPSLIALAVLLGFVGPPLNGIIAFTCGNRSRKNIVSQVHMDELIEKVDADPNPDLHFLEPTSQEYARVEQENKVAAFGGEKPIQALRINLSETGDYFSPCPVCGNTLNKPGSIFCMQCGARL